MYAACFNVYKLRVWPNLYICALCDSEHKQRIMLTKVSVNMKNLHIFVVSKITIWLPSEMFSLTLNQPVVTPEQVESDM
jgi:hypothetical protein